MFEPSPVRWVVGGLFAACVLLGWKVLNLEIQVDSNSHIVQRAIDAPTYTQGYMNGRYIGANIAIHQGVEYLEGQGFLAKGVSAEYAEKSIVFDSSFYQTYSAEFVYPENIDEAYVMDEILFPWDDCLSDFDEFGY